MPFTDTKIKIAAKNFKEESIQLLEKYDLAKVDLAAEFGVSEQSVSRWFHPYDESNFPGFLIHRCIASPDAKIKSFGLSLAKYCTDDAGYSVIENMAGIQLNGTLTDEVLATVREIGRLSGMTDIPVDKAGEMKDSIDMVIAYAFAMKNEIDRKMGK